VGGDQAVERMIKTDKTCVQCIIVLVLMRFTNGFHREIVALKPLSTARE
jgi:hypothetical protein